MSLRVAPTAMISFLAGFCLAGYQPQRVFEFHRHMELMASSARPGAAAGLHITFGCVFGLMTASLRSVRRALKCVVLLSSYPGQIFFSVYIAAWFASYSRVPHFPKLNRPGTPLARHSCSVRVGDLAETFLRRLFAHETSDPTAIS